MGVATTARRKRLMSLEEKACPLPVTRQLEGLFAALEDVLAANLCGHLSAWLPGSPAIQSICMQHPLM